MSATVSGLRRKPRALDVIPAGGFADDRISGPDSLDVFQLCAERADPIGDQSEEKTLGVVGCECLHGAPKIGSKQIGPLEIHAGKPVDLDVK